MSDQPQNKTESADAQNERQNEGQQPQGKIHEVGPGEVMIVIKIGDGSEESHSE